MNKKPRSFSLIIIFILFVWIYPDFSPLFESQSERTRKIVAAHALPLKIFVSTGTGRRFVCMYSFITHRFTNFRLDYIKTVILNEKAENAPQLKEKLNNNLDKIWGVNFGGKTRSEIVCLKHYIDEKREMYIIDRVKREGQGGELTKLEDNTFLFVKEVFDSTDMSPWVKTFIGRIIGLEGSNELFITRFYSDIERMADMYGIEAAGEGRGC